MSVDVEVSAWYGLLAPAGTPRDIITRLNAEWIKIAATTDARETIQKIGFEPLSSTPEQFAEFIRTETVRWRKVIREANLSIDSPFERGANILLTYRDDLFILSSPKDEFLSTVILIPPNGEGIDLGFSLLARLILGRHCCRPR